MQAINLFQIFIFLGVLATILFACTLLFLRFARRSKHADHENSGVVFLVQDDLIVDETYAARLAMAIDGKSELGWGALFRSFGGRFSGMPSTFSGALTTAPLRIPSSITGDTAQLVIVAHANRLKVSLDQPNSDNCIALHHRALQDRSSLEAMTKTISQSPYPVWVENLSGQPLWQNSEYARLQSVHEQNFGPQHDQLFAIDQALFKGGETQRVNLPDDSECGETWFEVSMNETHNTRTFFAVNITALVHAERAQRSFVQTLTKTFAQLSTGLAIFDRDRQLVLFNPALIELTQLSGEFLSARPTLTSFFDWLREARVMPEPRDYAEWRQKLTELTKAATEGTFSELWSLPNGLSYRVFGRPHPDGAIAFLFEDVTAELSLTRNFINESEINNALLDTLPEAIIVFSPSGEVLSTNSAYSRLMGEGHNTQIRSMEVSQVVKMWAREHGPSKHWDKIEKVLTNPADTKSCSGTVERKNETGIGYRISPLAKCAVAIVFWHCASSVHRSVPEDILA